MSATDKNKESESEEFSRVVDQASSLAKKTFDAVMDITKSFKGLLSSADGFQKRMRKKTK